MNTTSNIAPVVVAPKGSSFRFCPGLTVFLDSCEAEKDVVVFKSVGFRLRNLGVPPLFQNSSETECVFSCLVNLARGHVPYNCGMFSDYFILLFPLCDRRYFVWPFEWLLDLQNRNNKHTRYLVLIGWKSLSMLVLGNGHLIPEATFTHYEKACVSSKFRSEQILPITI